MSLLAYKFTKCSVFLTMKVYTPSANIFDILYHYLRTYLYNTSYSRLYFCLDYAYKGVTYRNSLSFLNKLGYLVVVVLNVILFTILDCSKLVFSFLIILLKALLQYNRRPYVYAIRELNSLIERSYFFRPAPRIIHLVYGVGIRINPNKISKKGVLVGIFERYINDFSKDAIKLAVSDKLPSIRDTLLKDLKQIHVTSNHLDGSGRIVGHKLITNSKGFGYQIGTSNNQGYFGIKGVEFGYTPKGKVIYGHHALITDQKHASISEDWNELSVGTINEYYHKLLSGSQKNIALFEFNGCEVVVRVENIDNLIRDFGVPRLLFDVPHINNDVILAGKASGYFNDYFTV